MKRKELPNLFKPIFNRILSINTALESCNTWSCGECKYFKSRDCYKDIGGEIEEVARLMGVLANGVKKMD